jgi:twitching motility protein PilT
MNRIIALAERSSDDIRDRIADSLQGIIAQRLLPRADRPGLVLAAEVLIATGSVRESIRRPQGNPPLKELMENGGDLYGMQTFEMHIKRLVREGYLEREVARAAIASSPRPAPRPRRAGKWLDGAPRIG